MTEDLKKKKKKKEEKEIKDYMLFGCDKFLLVGVLDFNVVFSLILALRCHPQFLY